MRISHSPTSRLWCRCLVAAAALILAAPAQAAEAEAKIGVVLMHGKLDERPGRALNDLANYLRGQGFLVAIPEMPWSKARGYDKTFDAALDEIAADLEGLRQKGADRLVIGGHSLGANAALAYAASRGGVAGVILLAPGHTPFRKKSREEFAESLARAQEMVAAGKGQEKAQFRDSNQGSKYNIQVRADVYLSFFDPEGLGSMPRMAHKLSPDIPLLVVIGSWDPLYDAARSLIFDKAPANPRSRYVEVKAGHVETPTEGKRQIADWIKSLAE